MVLSFFLALILGLILWLFAMAGIALALAIPVALVFLVIGYFAKDQKKPAQRQRRKRTATAVKETPPPAPKEVPVNPEAILSALDQVRSEIADPEIRESLTSTIEQLQQILKMDGRMTKTNKIFQTYLPSLTAILKDFGRLEVSGNSEELARTKEKLHRIINLINTAVGNILSDLQEEHRDMMEQDIHQLETLLKSDGVVNQMENPFQKR